MTEQDKQKIMRTGVCLCHATVDGVSVVTNVHVLLRMEPWFENDEGSIVKPASVERKWHGLPECLGKAKPVRVTAHSKFGEKYVVTLSNDAQLNTAYLYLFDGCEVFSSGKYEPAIFVRDGAIAGVLMPLRDIPAASMTACEAPTLEQVFAAMAADSERRIKDTEKEIEGKRFEIKALEDEIAELEGCIEEIRKSMAGVSAK